MVQMEVLLFALMINVSLTKVPTATRDLNLASLSVSFSKICKKHTVTNQPLRKIWAWWKL